MAHLDTVQSKVEELFEDDSDLFRDIEDTSANCKDKVLAVLRTARSRLAEFETVSAKKEDLEDRESVISSASTSVNVDAWLPKLTFFGD